MEREVERRQRREDGGVVECLDCGASGSGRESVSASVSESERGTCLAS